MNEGGRQSAEEISLFVKGASSQASRNVDVIKMPHVYAIKTFPELMNCAEWKEEIEMWPYLKNIPLTKASKSDGTLHFGQDNAGALLPLELRRAGYENPYAMRTLLGWTINGPVNTSKAEERRSVTFVDVKREMYNRLQSQVEIFSWSEPQLSVSDKKKGLCMQSVLKVVMSIPRRDQFVFFFTSSLCRQRS